MTRTGAGSPFLFASCCIMVFAAAGVHAEAVMDTDTVRLNFDPITPRQISAVERGLAFLARKQHSDGHFDDNGQYPTAMTALVGLAFLSAGSTPRRGPYCKQVRKAMQWLLKQQDAKGLISNPSDGRSMYGHGFGTLFLSQCYGMDLTEEESARVAKALKKAVKVIAESQSHNGGWYYTPYANADEGSVTVTQVQALRGCANNGIDVPKQTIRKAVQYIEKSQAPDGTIRYSISSGGSGSTALTAAGVEVFFSLGQYTKQSSKVRKSLNTLKKAFRRRQNEGHEAYTIFYAAQAFHQSSEADFAKYYPDIRSKLLKQQQSNGAFPGDWVGEIYGTALSVMVLTIPYELLPIFQR